MMKNGVKFEFEEIKAYLAEEVSEEITRERNIKTGIIVFSVSVTQFENRDKFSYELKGNIEVDADGCEPEFYDGQQYRPYVTLVSGDILDPEFNGIIKDFFNEDCDICSLIFDNLNDEIREKLDKIIEEEKEM